MSYYQKEERKEGEIDEWGLRAGVQDGFRPDCWGNVIRAAWRTLECAGLPKREIEDWYACGSEYQCLRMKKPMPADSPQVAASDGTDSTLKQEQRGAILIEYDGISSKRGYFRKDIADILTKYGYTII